MKKLFKFYLFTGVIFLCACSSYKYSNSDAKERNNTILITSDNVKDFTVSYADNSSYIRNGSGNVFIRSLTKRNLNISLTNPIYDQIEIKLSRVVRPGALIKDIALGIFTFGIPLIVDPFRADFYKIPSKKREFNAHFEYKQSYMKDEYKKIYSSKNPNDFQVWIDKYIKSKIREKVINHKDSIELDIALGKQSEAEIDAFIAAHQNSNQLNKAAIVKKQMVDAREMFESSKKKNTVESYEEFLAKFPSSLHNKDAHRNLVTAAEKVAIQSGKLTTMVNYILNYLDVNSSFFTSNEIDEKKLTISNAIDKQLVADYVKNDSKKYYENYSDLWKRYKVLQKEIPSNYLVSMEKTESFMPKICDLLFLKIKDAKTAESQSLLAKKASEDFPELDPEDKNTNIIYTALRNAPNGSGSIKLFNLSYMKYFFDTESERSSLKGWDYYSYKSQDYRSLLNANNEELQFLNGQLSGTIKCNENSMLDFVITIDEQNQAPKEVSYYQNGQLVKTIYLANGKINYEYEFENGTNLTLKALDEKIQEGDSYLASEDFERAISTYENALKNNYPNNIKQNVLLNKNLTIANNKKLAYEKKQEQIRIEEEKKQEQKRIEEEKARQNELKAIYSQLEDVTINYVVNRLKSPSTASVVLYNNPDITRNMLNESRNYLPKCEEVFATMLTVDAQNSFGAYIRSTYVLFFKNNRPCHLEDVKSIDRARNSMSTVGEMNSMLRLTLELNGCSCNE
jgi:hypothetical protein